MKKNDRRVNRTRRALQEALQELITEKGYEAVTVEEITGRANLGRTTFYLHYRDKEDLLLESFGELVDDLFQEIAQIPLSAWKLDEAAPARQPGLTAPTSPPQSSGNTPSLVTPLRMIFQHARDNTDLYRLVLRGAGLHRVSGRLHEFIITAVHAFLHMKAEEEGVRLEMRVPMEVFSNYFASALIGMVTWWLENDTPFPVERMAEMFERLFLPGAREAIELK